MTRCLDCGSERTTDQCPSCGLTSAAAEVMFRRRLVFRTAIFLLGSLAFPYISQVFPPLDIDLMLIFFGVIFFTALFLAVTLERRARNRKEIEILKRIYAGFIPLPWILAATLFVNGRLDNAKNITVDGITAMDSGSNASLSFEPNMDSIAEVRVLTSNYQAEYGRNLGGGIMAIWVTS